MKRLTEARLNSRAAFAGTNDDAIVAGDLAMIDCEDTIGQRLRNIGRQANANSTSTAASGVIQCRRSK